MINMSSAYWPFSVLMSYPQKKKSNVKWPQLIPNEELMIKTKETNWSDTVR